MTATLLPETRREDIVDLQCAMVHLIATDVDMPHETARDTLPSADELEDWIGDSDRHPLDEADAEIWLDRIAAAGLMA